MVKNWGWELWRRLWDRCHLTLSVQCPRLWCLKGSPWGKPYCCSRNSSCSISKLQRGGIAETQQLKIECCRRWGIQRSFLHTGCSKSHQLFLNVEMILLLLLCSRIEFTPCLNCFGACRKEVLSMSLNFFKGHQCFSLKPYLQCCSAIK